MIRWNHDPTPTQLRQFAVAATVVLPTAAWGIGLPFPIISGIAILGVLGVAVSVHKPEVMRWPFLVAQALTAPIGWCLSLCFLLLIYAFCVVPVAALLRVLHRDPLRLSKRHRSESDWEEVAPDPVPIEHYRRQY